MLEWLLNDMWSLLRAFSSMSYNLSKKNETANLSLQLGCCGLLHHDGWKMKISSKYFISENCFIGSRMIFDRIPQKINLQTVI